MPTQSAESAAVVARPLGSGDPLRLALHPGVAVTVTLLLFGAVWLALLSYTSLSPPTDNIEQLTWVHSMEGGYYLVANPRLCADSLCNRDFSRGVFRLAISVGRIDSLRQVSRLVVESCTFKSIDCDRVPGSLREPQYLRPA